MDEQATEHIELPAQDEADLHRLYAEPDGGNLATFHPILQVWREVLRPAKGEQVSKITPNWANRIVSAFQEIKFADMENYRDSYFGKLFELADILDMEIATDDECLTYTEPADDALENAHHYKNLLLLWQLQIMQWELDWETTAPNAAVELAAISEVHKMFFGQTGLSAFLDNIGFEFNEDDSQMLMETLQEYRGGDGE